MSKLIPGFSGLEACTVLAVAGLLTAPWASPDAGAVPACPEPVTVEQPDGRKIKVHLRGDEFSHWHEDAAGFTILKDIQARRWIYAKPDSQGRLTPSTLVVGRDDPRKLGVAAHLLPAGAARAAASGRSRQSASVAQDSPRSAPKTGTMMNLVVLVQFPDLSATHTRAEFEALFNTVGYTADGAKGSVKDYYREVSHNTLDVTSVVTDWITLDHGYAYYGANDAGGNDLRPREMVQEALLKLEASGFNFSPLDADNDGWVDGLTVIHAGGGEEYSGNDPNYIWSHEWSMITTVTYDGKSLRAYHTEPERRGWDSSPSSQGLTRIGVICHETGHFLGLPDLYDYGYDSQGAGNFCLMAGGSWNGSYGSQPAHMSAWCKKALGWLTPTVVSAAGTYTVPRVEDSPTALRLSGPFASTEYFLVENRQGYGFDASLPGATRGLLIWHIDETQPNNNDQTHYKIDLEEASGTQHLELNQNSGDDADYYRQGNNTRFTSQSTPNNRSYSGATLGLNISAVSASGPSMTLTVSVNEPPTLDPLSNLSLNEDAGPQTVNLSGISAGPGESQTLTVTATSGNPSLIPNPVVTYTSPNATGSLTFTPTADAHGSAVISVMVKDDGGTNNGGVDLTTRSFTVTVNSVNDAPSFVGGPNKAVAQNAGPQTFTGWATAISAGPPDESGQALDFIVTTDKTYLFSVQPAVAADGTLSCTPNGYYRGTTTVRVKLHDSGGTSNGGQDTSAEWPFTITVGLPRDDDGDGLPDDWTASYFGAARAVPDADSDGDGFTNAQELAAGTNPMDPDDAPGITATEGNGNNVVIRFRTVPGKTYRVDRSESPQAGAWSPAGDTVAGTGQVLSVTDTNAAADQRGFYRVVVLP